MSNGSWNRKSGDGPGMNRTVPSREATPAVVQIKNHSHEGYQSHTSNRYENVDCGSDYVLVWNNWNPEGENGKPDAMIPRESVRKITYLRGETDE